MKKRISNWGNFPVINANEMTFVFADQLHDLVLENKDFIARGNGRCYGDASLAASVISTLKYDKILSFDKLEGIFECQSGILLDQVLEVIIPAGWFLPVTPGTKFITIGGAVASDIHGKNHYAEGSFSRYVMELDVFLVSGKSVTCSSEINSDLFESTCGGMGLTGVITRVRFKLKKIESSYIRKKQFRAENLEELILLMDRHRGYTYAAAWIDCLKKGPHSGRGILIVGEHARFSELDENKKANPFRKQQRRKFSFPVTLPSWALNVFAVKAFNLVFYSRQNKNEIEELVSYESFFYPLDNILHWNRAYGKKGFIQYQFVIPFEKKQGLFEVLNKIAERDIACFLAVLKILGKQESIISFAQEGYSLALDFPFRPGLLEFLDELDHIVIQCGGRLYLSKDARMKPEVLQAGYPGLYIFREVVNKYNPDGRIHSMLSDRLNLVTN
jgi:decaprenylphospho-beta-D-ribofuranose 2-oxidase